MNPLAVFLGNAKLRALATPAHEIEAALQASLKHLKKLRVPRISREADVRLAYLAKWFPPDTLALLETLRFSILEHGGQAESVLFSLASDLLRDYLAARTF